MHTPRFEPYACTRVLQIPEAAETDPSKALPAALIDVLHMSTHGVDTGDRESSPGPGGRRKVTN